MASPRFTDCLDDDGLRVQSTRCETCIFRPGNKMHLVPGRVEQMVADIEQHDSFIPCHETIYGQADKPSICRGQYDKHRTGPLQVAQRLGMVKFV